MRRVAVVVGAALLVAGCSTPESAERAPSPPRAKRLATSACDEPSATGKVERQGYDLRFTRGSMRVKVSLAGSEQCVEFAKWGDPNPEVPPDSLLFTFSGGRGDGAQLEFLSVDLAGGKLPDTRPLGKLNHPINATVGVSIGGTYYTSSTCSLTLTSSNAHRAAGRFDCPTAVSQAANPLDPSDDVSYDDPSTAPTATTAALSGRFDVR
ncbi:hypothetical protein nbrc107696_13730 [Gordonia spumicola]|uniref:Lipoprotein n=1 Tax=Gordonia spumicola TaxID=589161 RepID=A0A7I9V6L5_9ACTN|nr:hypothetical protein [Gordonia spumicola]GEE00927.1 hypothetical protein nbrc107696_13730 [Gordonia spumicola]